MSGKYDCARCVLIFLFWIMSVSSVIGLLGALAAALRLFRYFRAPVPENKPPHRTRFLSLSVAVPLKGMRPGYEGSLRALLKSRLDIPVEYLFVMETETDPAYDFCLQLQVEHPDLDIRVLLSGPAQDRMGKQHNLTAAAAAARHEVFCSMDADVLPGADTLQHALNSLEASADGSVFFLPGYETGARLGCKLVAAYTNQFFSLYIGSMAAGGTPAFTIGSLWMMSHETLAGIGGLDQFTAVVTDDAAIGRAVVQAGGTNTLCRAALRLQTEPLSLGAGVQQLLKWVVMLRAEGLPGYLAILWLWHPVLFATGAAISGILLGGTFSAAGLALLLLWMIVRASIVYRMNRELYRWNSPLSNLGAVFIYEILAAPLLFATGCFKRTLVWGGRRDGIGKGGVMRFVEQAPPE